MKLSVWSSYYYPLSPEEAVERLLANEISCTELSDEHGAMLFARGEDVCETGRRFAEFIAARGMEIPQGHLPLSVKICSEDLGRLYRWIDMYEAIGIKNMVLHCDNLADTSLTQEEKIEQNIIKLKEIAAYIEGRSITVCLENLQLRAPRSIEEILYIIDRVGSKQLGICLDTGHLNLTVKGHRNFILKAGARLKALHIADNDGVTDQHRMPFNYGTVDFYEVVRALREIGYEGIFNLEISGEAWIPHELRDAKLCFIKRGYELLMR